MLMQKEYETRHDWVGRWSSENSKTERKWKER